MSAGGFLILDATLTAFVSFDLVRALRTGRARGRGGTVTRKGQPQRFRRYVYADFVVLAFGVIGFIWALASPASF